jgi:hypothetical protein
MKNIKSILLILFLVSVGTTLSAQKYFVYDGDDFSVMFTCNSDNTKVLQVEFSAKDSNGEWKWNKFDIYDSEDYDDSEVSGFTYYCKDAQGNKFAVDYFTDEDYVMVYALKDDGSYGTEWELKRRADDN